MARSKQQQVMPSLLFLDDPASHSCIHTAAVTSARIQNLDFNQRLPKLANLWNAQGTFNSTAPGSPGAFVISQIEQLLS